MAVTINLLFRPAMSNAVRSMGRAQGWAALAAPMPARMQAQRPDMILCMLNCPPVGRYFADMITARQERVMAHSQIPRPMSHAAMLPRLCIDSTERREGMFRWFLRRQIARFERTWNYDAGYLRELIEIDPRAVQALGKLQSISNYRKDVPRAVWAAAGIDRKSTRLNSSHSQI